MKQILKIIMICIVLLVSNFNLVNAHTISKEQAQYLAAWTSLAVYNDKFSLLAREILRENNWQIDVYNERIVKSDVKYLLASNRENNQDCYFLSISGTSSWQDVKTDLNVETTAFSGNNVQAFAENLTDTVLEKDKPLVHKGFLTYVQDGFFTANGQGEIVGLSIAQKLRTNSQAKIYIVGHSLGGAVAELFAARLLDLGINSSQIETITFGAPAVGNQIFVDEYEPRLNLTRITMNGDIVTNLAQIANNKLVQFKNQEQWFLPTIENDKFAHNMLLYFDRAGKIYYDKEAEIIRNQLANTVNPKIYVAPIAFNFPKELISTTKYIELALLDKMRHSDEAYIVENDVKVTDYYYQAKQIGAKYVVFYEFSAVKMKENTSNKRYYISGSKFIYDVDKNLIKGYSANTDTSDMSIVQAALYVENQCK